MLAFLYFAFSNINIGEVVDILEADPDSFDQIVGIEFFVPCCWSCGCTHSKEEIRHQRWEGVPYGEYFTTCRECWIDVEYEIHDTDASVESLGLEYGRDYGHV